jgi:hypothetical protein
MPGLDITTGHGWLETAWAWQAAMYSVICNTNGKKMIQAMDKTMNLAQTSSAHKTMILAITSSSHKIMIPNEIQVI